MENAFYFMLKAFFVLEIITFLSWGFGYVEEWLDKKAMVNFNIYAVTDCTANQQFKYCPISQEVKAAR